MNGKENLEGKHLRKRKSDFRLEIQNNIHRVMFIVLDVEK